MNLSQPTILIVDDDAQNCRLLAAMLRPEGYSTVSVASGAAALAAVAQAAPDLILLDVMMPDMDGFEVARRLKAATVTADIPIILVTALDDGRSRLMGLDAGADEFLTKPVNWCELGLRVRNLLRVKSLNDLLKNYNDTLEAQVQARTIELHRFRAAMDATADAILLINRSTLRFFEFNSTALAMLGYSREELLQMGPAQLGAGATDELERAYDALIECPRPNEVTAAIFHRKNGGQFPVELRQHAQRDGAEWIIVCVVQDVSERQDAQLRIAPFDRFLRVASDAAPLE